MNNRPLMLSVVTLICGGLMACLAPIPEDSELSSASGTTADTGTVETSNSTDSEPESPEFVEEIADNDIAIRLVEGEEKARIFDQVIDAQADLNLCLDGDNLNDNFEYSDVYAKGPEYLVSVLCFNAAYQGSYEFVYVNNLGDVPLELTKADLALAGYPSMDLETGVLSNGYKFTGAGTCFEYTEHYWDGYSLQLMSSRLEDGVENGCADIGVRSPSEDYLISASGVGLVKLGMTIGELKQALPEGYTMSSTVLGVDLPSAMEIRFYGDLQLEVGVDSWGEPVTDNSIIEMIAVKNPAYRTAEGVGPGTLIEEAIAHYGTATLNFNYDNEGRESIEFADGPFPSTVPHNVWLRSNQWTVTDFAGIYPDSDESYQVTQEFHDHAAIASIWIMK